jgi:uncharacterized protein (TIGR02246 family)
VIGTPRLPIPSRRARRGVRGVLIGCAISSAVLVHAVAGIAAPPSDSPRASGAGPASTDLAVEMKAILDRDAAAWNRGDLEAFCAVYTDDATFVTPTGLTRGRATVLERYRTKYPTARERGELSFELVEARPVAGADSSAPPAAVSVVARWHLRYADRPEAAGWTLLVYHRDAAGAWRIVQDASM